MPSSPMRCLVERACPSCSSGPKQTEGNLCPTARCCTACTTVVLLRLGENEFNVKCDAHLSKHWPCRHLQGCHRPLAAPPPTPPHPPPTRGLDRQNQGTPKVWRCQHSPLYVGTVARTPGPKCLNMTRHALGQLVHQVTAPPRHATATRPCLPRPIPTPYPWADPLALCPGPCPPLPPIPHPQASSPMPHA